MAHERYQSAIETCMRCAQECEHFAAEFAGSFASLVRLFQDVAQLCWATSASLSRGSHFFPELCEVCAHACQTCAEESEKGPDVQLARCAEICRQCADECLKMAEETPPQIAVPQGSAISPGLAPAL